jgi:phospho-N-acetylmuramoyl-pentapeptide-transferase
MLFLLAKHFREWLEAHGLGFLRVFTFPTFQSVVAVLASFFTCILLGPSVIEWLRHKKIGDNPNFDHAQLNEAMAGKKGTPTMGGILIIAAIASAVLMLADLSSFYVRMALLCLIWLGAVGAVDDWLKLTAGHRGGSRQGLTSLEKILFQFGLGILLSVFTYHYGAHVDWAHTLYVPLFKDFKPMLNLTGFAVIGTLVIVGSSNAVNLTDGLDGLASGCMAIVSFAFLVLALIIGDYAQASYLNLPVLAPAGQPAPGGQMAVIAGALLGACLGFRWFNCNPARVFMGDTGSLALGGLIGYISIVIRQELVLFLVGGIFVAEAMSVMLQVGYFKYTKRRFGEGRRIFLMSPLHHHFQRKGWTENQVVVRFWLVGAMLAALALATVKLR